MKRLFLFLLLLPVGLMASDAEKPNIIFFLVDDLGVMDSSVPMYADKAGEVVAQPLNA